ncbi:MAG: c-type cytochrome biogenesis protein CcmI [Gammaproteobacteria bacterium]|nr:c-type cytochrome biogenesis protein CcmI [Gammaproteobacteria bacterium]
MNILFWVLMVLMLLAAISLLVYPLLRVRQSPTLAYKDSNLKINDEKIRELDIDLQEGRIDHEFYKVARGELDRELLLDIPEESHETSAQHYTGSVKRHPAIALLISVFVPMLVLFLYLDLGMHNASDESFVSAQAQQSKGPPSVEEMTKTLEAKIQKDGGSVQEWTMLARAHKYLAKNDLAAKAFAVALEKDKDNAQLMLELAEVQALSNNRVFTKEGISLVQRAYELEPENPNALWFVGVAEYQNGNYHQAIAHLKKLLPLVLTEEEVMKSIISIIARSRDALIAAGEEMPELVQILDIESLKLQVEAAAETAPEQATKMTAGVQLQISVDVDQKVKQKFDANDTVFVYAKAKQGPRMPLAVQRLTLASLPASVVLDDSMAMVEGMNLSAFDQLVISARVTKTGSAIAQSGDYIGQIETGNKSTTLPLKITIDTIVP